MFRPIPPAPKTAIDWPILSRASWLITPKAVVTAQPKSTALSGSKSAGMVVIRFSDTTATSLKVVDPAGIHRPQPGAVAGCDRLQAGTLAQCGATRSPAWTVRTPAPHSRTMPVPSCPSRCGRKRSGPLTPSISPTCEPQMPLHKTRTRTCPSTSGNLDLLQDEGLLLFDENGGQGFHLSPPLPPGEGRGEGEL